LTDVETVGCVRRGGGLKTAFGHHRIEAQQLMDRDAVHH
jgi:hypothetical protein